jgi:superfamily II DNA or RNA helicase
MSNQEKGLLYEKHVKEFIIQTLCKNAYLWNECPETILIDNKLIHSHNTMRLLRKDAKEGHIHSHKDIGIDIIQVEPDKCSIVQCKNGYQNGLCVDDIAGIMMRSAFIRNVNTFIYYTNCLSRNILYTSGISPYVSHIDCSGSHSNIDELAEVSNDNKIYFVKLPYENSNNEAIEEIDIVPEIVAYSYQAEALNTLKKHYDTINRGILSLPCGTGKTFTSYLISNDYKQVIILSPLREFASQNLNKFIEYGYDKKNTRLVDSDGDRDIESIKGFIQSNNRFVISCTYKSTDLISECLELFNDALFIIDEFHNLSKSNISSKDDNIYKLLISKHRILYMSATPRIYDIEYDNIDDNTDDDTDNEDEDETVDTEQLFGDVVYQMTFTDAIANKYITDYRIWLPSIHENNEELDKELSIYEIDNEIKNRCKFLYSCIANNGSRKCIVYCRNDTEDMKAMMECMKTLNEFYIMDIEMNSISCEDSEKKRKRVLKSFSNGDDKIQLLFNIRILNECIDIPACDSVYISYPPKNKITTIQRISRATRIDKNNPYKVANVYIWCEEYDDILETLSSIKEYDIMFKDKVKISTVDFYNNKGQKELEIIENDRVLLSNCIIGVKEFRVITWEEKLAMVEEYIKEHGKLPSKSNKNKNIRSLAGWVWWQKKNYINMKYNMSNKQIRSIWENFEEKYQEVFKSNEEIWIENKNKLEEYIQANNKLPSQSDKNRNIVSLANWTQLQIYKAKQEDTKYIKRHKCWEDLTNKYDYLFKSNEEIWVENKNKVEEYIQKYNKLPSQHDKDKYVSSLGSWVNAQKINYKYKKDRMSREDNRIIWKNFEEKYKEVFMKMSKEGLWFVKLGVLEEYITKHKQLPFYTKDEKIRALARWVVQQQKNYVDTENKNKIMSVNENIRTIWKNFEEKYKEIFKSNMSYDEVWFAKKNKVEEYIQANNKLPSQHDKDKYVSSLRSWINIQKLNYKNKKDRMSREEHRKKWDDFILKYPHLF